MLNAVNKSLQNNIVCLVEDKWLFCSNCIIRNEFRGFRLPQNDNQHVYFELRQLLLITGRHFGSFLGVTETFSQ